jgi:hypothetical protein
LRRWRASHGLSACFRRAARQQIERFIKQRIGRVQ